MEQAELAVAIARVQRSYYEALQAQVFSQAEALRIVESNQPSFTPLRAD